MPSESKYRLQGVLAFMLVWGVILGGGYYYWHHPSDCEPFPDGSLSCNDDAYADPADAKYAIMQTHPYLVLTVLLCGCFGISRVNRLSEQVKQLREENSSLRLELQAQRRESVSAIDTQETPHSKPSSVSLKDSL